MEGAVPDEVAEGWELYQAVQGGMIQPLTYREYLALPDNLCSELAVILEIVPAALEAKRQTTVSK